MEQHNNKRTIELNVLVIEDNYDDFLLLTDSLSAEGYSVHSIRVDTEESLLAAMIKPWDIVFSDYSMPKMNGAKALKIVREHDTDIPFVFISGTIGESTAVNAIKQGAQDYIMKSDMTRLPHVVDRELREAKARREQHQAETMLKKLSQAIGQTADCVFITDIFGHFEYVNPAFESLTGYRLEDVKGDTPARLKSERQNIKEHQRLWATISTGSTYKGTLINRRKDGSEYFEEKVISPLYDDQGKITHFVSTGRDMTARILANQSRKRFQSVLDITPDLVAIIRPEGDMVYLNTSGFQILGLEADLNIQEQTYTSLFPEKLKHQFATEIIPAALQQGSWSGESVLPSARQGQQDIPASIIVLKHTDKLDNKPYLSIVARDISDRIRFERDLQHQANHDSLTGLPNRYYLLDRLKSSIAMAKRRKTQVAILYLDLDGFKRVNDTLGHQTGDELLQAVAKQLQGKLRSTHTIARLGGDEFTIILDDLTHPDEVISVISRLYRSFKSPIILGNQEFFITFSTGIALFPQDGQNESDLLKHADMAMYRAKSSGSNQYQFYAAGMDSRSRELFQMDIELRRALTNRELCLFYQPQIDPLTRKLVGVEALLRWPRPGRDPIPPSEFIPLLESSGLIMRVGNRIIKEACAQYHRFRDAGFADVRMSVNVSAIQFQNPQFLEQVKANVESAAMPAGILELEITENIVMQDPGHAADLLVALHQLGVRTAIDDFGTGYSSLAYLKRFPLHTLKIDRSFITDVTNSSSDAAIVEASISLAHKLGLQVVAEGVESEDQLRFLEKLNCNVIQGYLFSKPVSENDIMPLLGKIYSL